MQKIHSIIKKKNTWSDNRNVLVCVWCSSLFEWASLQITLLWEKLILTADNQTETRRLGINQQQSPSIHFDCPPTLSGFQRRLIYDETGFSDYRRVWVDCLCVSCACMCLGSTGAVLGIGRSHSWSSHHNICHSKANITLTTSRLRAISSRMQCCCHSWFSFL